MHRGACIYGSQGSQGREKAVNAQKGATATIVLASSAESDKLRFIDESFCCRLRNVVDVPESASPILALGPIAFCAKPHREGALNRKTNSSGLDWMRIIIRRH